jgi:hypothetical protein
MSAYGQGAVRLSVVSLRESRQALTIEIDRCVNCGTRDSQLADTPERSTTDIGTYQGPMRAHGGRSS